MKISIIKYNSAMTKTFTYSYQNKEYEVIVTYKRIKNVIYRFKDDKFYISASFLAGQKQILKGLDKYAPKFIKKENKPFAEDYFYIFGEKFIVGDSGKLKLTNGEMIEYSSKEDLYQKLKPLFLSLVSFRVKEFANKMGLPLYQVKAREMTTRYGTNSLKTKTLYFSYQLMHYSIPIIDSVVIHELAHIKVFNHSKKFYDYLYQYCPDYQISRKKLLKRIYQ